MRCAVALAGLVVVPALAVAASTTSQAAPSHRALAAPTHSLSVTGTGAAMYPAYDPTIRRYGITTTDATEGTVTIDASTSDPDGTVLIDGVPMPGGHETLSGLKSGDEIAVFIVDSAGTERDSLIYLPTGFPSIERTTPDPAPGTLQPGLTLLTLSLFTTGAPYFETAVDENGVPAFVRVPPRPAGDPPRTALDLKALPGGGYTVSEQASAADPSQDLVELSPQLTPVRSWHTLSPLTNTDGHDSILEPDGTVWLLAYQPNPVTGLTDSVVQEINPDGTVGFQWGTAPWADQTMVPPGAVDYAHVNSIQLVGADQDLLISFRNLSSVWLVATQAHDGHQPGDVIWRLGGRDSSFAFPAGENGPCAQHFARMLPDGNVMIFDNGSSAGLPPALCVDESDPTGPGISRVQTRVVEWELDLAAHTATPHLVYERPGTFTFFAGSAEREANGDTLVDYSVDTTILTNEVASDGTVLWQLVDSSADKPFSYRATRAVVPDAISPVVTLTSPASGATYVEGTAASATYSCTDAGGSGLQTCSGSTGPGQPLDTTTPGPHPLTVTATDGAGNVSTVTHTYTVLPVASPSVTIRLKGSDQAAAHVSTRLRRTGQQAVLHVQLTNGGALPDRLALTLVGHRHGLRVDHRVGLVSPSLPPGATWTVKVIVVRGARARAGARLALSVVAASTRVPSRSDTATAVVRSPGSG